MTLVGILVTLLTFTYIVQVVSKECLLVDMIWKGVAIYIDDLGEYVWTFPTTGYMAKYQTNFSEK